MTNQTDTDTNVLPFLVAPKRASRKIQIGDETSGILEVELFDDILEGERLEVAKLTDTAKRLIAEGKELEAENLLIQGQALAIIRHRINPKFSDAAISGVEQAIVRALSDVFIQEMRAHRKRAEAMVKAALGEDPKARARAHG
jgi:hypothetical protein